MPSACSIFIVACVLCSNSAWQTTGMRTILIPSVETLVPEGPAPIWPMPPPGSEHKLVRADPTMTSITTWQAYGRRTRSTPAPTSTSIQGFPFPAEALWPLPPPGKDYDRLVAERIEKRKAEHEADKQPKNKYPFPPEALWPLPPPGKDHDRLLAERMEKLKAEHEADKQPKNKYPFPAEALWPLPPPGKDHDRLLAERIEKLKTEHEADKVVNRFVTAEDLPVWRRFDTTPARRSNSIKHRRLHKRPREQNRPTQKTRDNNAINIQSEEKEPNPKWPKVRDRSDQRRDYVRSTRLAPNPDHYKLVQDDPTSNAPIKRPSNTNMDGAFNQYSMKDDLETMLRDIDEANVTVEVLTRTVEYNDIVICKITQSKLRSRYFRADEDKYMDEEPVKKIIFIVHGLSAMGFTLVPCLNEKKSFMKLLKYYTAHLDKFDIFIVPIANPDGIGDETLIFWNKNKSPQSACLGVALDRNFDVSWNASASNSCHQQYPGPSPFSELESRAIGDVLHHYSQKIIAYIHVHAGTYLTDVFKGDAVLYPKGFTEATSEDDKYIDIKGEIDEAIRGAGFKVVSVGMETLYNWYGKVHGSSVDFASTIYGVPYAMEFVMQPYDDVPGIANSEEKVSDNVLTEIWKRVIDVVFTNIYKNTHANDVN